MRDRIFQGQTAPNSDKIRPTEDGYFVHSIIPQKSKSNLLINFQHDLLSSARHESNLKENGSDISQRFCVQPPTTVPQEFSEELLEMLDVLDIYLYHDQALWSQLCQILRHNIKYYKYQQKTLSISERIQEKLVWVRDIFSSSLSHEAYHNEYPILVVPKKSLDFLQGVCVQKILASCIDKEPEASLSNDFHLLF